MNYGLHLGLVIHQNVVVAIAATLQVVDGVCGELAGRGGGGGGLGPSLGARRPRPWVWRCFPGTPQSWIPGAASRTGVRAAVVGGVPACLNGAGVRRSPPASPASSAPLAALRAPAMLSSAPFSCVSRRSASALEDRPCCRHHRQQRPRERLPPRRGEEDVAERPSTGTLRSPGAAIQKGDIDGAGPDPARWKRRLARWKRRLHRMSAEEWVRLGALLRQREFREPRVQLRRTAHNRDGHNERCWRKPCLGRREQEEHKYGEKTYLTATAQAAA